METAMEAPVTGCCGETLMLPALQAMKRLRTSARSDASVDGAPVVGQRLVDRVGALASKYPGTGLGARVGIAFVENPPDDVEMVLREADRAAYEAKSSGKTRVTLKVVSAS
jgi:GGDEF domain-containing protein